MSGQVTHRRGPFHAGAMFRSEHPQQDRLTGCHWCFGN